MSKYILISGSPRKGNTEYVLLEIYNNLKKEIQELKEHIKESQASKKD